MEPPNPDKNNSTGILGVSTPVLARVINPSGIPRKPMKSLTPAEWKRARLHYETGTDNMRVIAALYGVAYTTVRRHAHQNKWRQQRAVLRHSRVALVAATDAALETEIQGAGREIARRTVKSMQPWIEKEGRFHVRDAVRRKKLGLRIVDSFLKNTVDDSNTPLDPKQLQFAAKTADIYDMIGRRNLGLNDASATGSSLDIRVLTNQVAVEVQTRKPDSA